MKLRSVRRPLIDGQLLPQGEVLEGELAVAAAEEREEWSRRVIIGLGFSPDQSRQINHLFTGRSFGEGQPAITDINRAHF